MAQPATAGISGLGFRQLISNKVASDELPVATLESFEFIKIPLVDLLLSYVYPVVKSFHVGSVRLNEIEKLTSSGIFFRYSLARPFQPFQVRRVSSWSFIDVSSGLSRPKLVIATASMM